jgi:inorganic pyrophosphatase
LLLVLPVKAPRFDDVRTILDFSERVRSEIERFFVNVVTFEGKDLQLLGFAGPDEGDRLVRGATQLANAR